MSLGPNIPMSDAGGVKVLKMSGTRMPNSRSMMVLAPIH